MNNCRAGLYSFASTITWLHETGMASPPFLIMLGLTLPDSRILSGVASIGLTLANIAVILPHLRQPILNSMHANKCALANEQSTREQTHSSGGLNCAQLVDPNMECPSLAVVPPCDKEHQTLPCSTTVESIGFQVASPTIPQPSAGRTDDDQVSPQNHRSMDDESGENPIHFTHSLREDQRPIYTPLPVPDAAEVAFFDATQDILSNPDLGEECLVALCAQNNIPQEHFEQDAEQGGQLATADLARTPAYVEVNEGLVDTPEREGSVEDLVRTDQAQCTIVKSPEADQPVTHENVVPTQTKVTVEDHFDPVAKDIILRPPDDHPARGGAAQGAQAGHSSVEGKETPTKRRPESLEFIPQSVIRRYPSAQTPSATRCFGHRIFSSRQDGQCIPISPHVLVRDSTMLSEEIRPRASYATLKESWCTPFLTEVHPNGQSMGGQSFFTETASAQDSDQQGLAEPSTVHGPTTSGWRPGALTCTALRNRRYAARCWRDNADDDCSASDSDSESDSDSHYSSGSSAYEHMLPHMLGADLIAAIDANSESELNLVGSRRALHAPLDVYQDWLVSEDSAADVSMVMHASSNDDEIDEVRFPATFRPLTHADIRQWASGVVQKCARQDCRSRAAVEPSSPSEASDVCAERPSGSGTSQCPLTGLHCKLGAAALAEVQVSRTKDIPKPSVSISTNRKPLLVRSLRDVPEFVPRQRRVSGMTMQVERARRPGTRFTDAATEVIARMESQAGFNTLQRMAGEVLGPFY